MIFLEFTLLSMLSINYSSSKYIFSACHMSNTGVNAVVTPLIKVGGSFDYSHTSG